MNLNIFYAKSEKGHLVFSNKKALQDFLHSVEGKQLAVSIGKERGIRSDNQHRYYWAYLRIIANETGHTEDELHQLFKRLFLRPNIIKVLGREIKVPATTKELSKIEFGEYLDRICAEVNIPLPDPKDISNIIALHYPQENHKPTF
jgi:hypothetical protein